MNKINFKDIVIFIKKYFSTFLTEKVEVFLEDNYIFIFINNKKLSIKIIPGENNNFISNNSYIEDKKIKQLFNKLLNIININVEIPLYIKIGSQKKENKKICYLFGNNGDYENFSLKDFDLLKFSKNIYTNNIKELIKIKEKFDYNFLVKDYNELIIEKNLKQEEIVIFFYGDYFENDNGILQSILGKIINNYKILINSFYSNFIERYVLSYANYGNLYNIGFFNKKDYIIEKENIFKNIEKYIDNDRKLIINDIGGFESMLQESSLSISFKEIDCLKKFLIDLTNIENIKKYSLEIFYKVKNGYVRKIDKNFNLLEENYIDNIGYISVFISRDKFFKNKKSFLGFREEKINTKNKFIFLASPLGGRVNEYSIKLKESLKKSEIIFGETIESVKNNLENLGISDKNKKIYFGDELITLGKIRQNIRNDLEFDLEYIVENIEKIIPNLKRELDLEKDIYFLSDGGVPCILDPGDLIKKYIGIEYKTYGVYLEKGPSVIDTVLLSCSFSFKTFYWASFLYIIKPFYKELINIGYFDKNFLNNTLIIFYSFGKEFKNDLKILKEIFGINIKLQLLGDIGTYGEYNKLFTNLDLLNKDINYICNNLENIVYLLKK